LGLSSGNAGGTIWLFAGTSVSYVLMRKPLPIKTEGVKYPELLAKASENAPVRTISREVFVTPQRLYAGHPDGMMRQSELPSDRKLSDQRLALHT
jgi:hypothetical protein